MRDWLTIIVIIALVLVLLDGFRRKRQENRTKIKIKLDKNIPSFDEEDERLPEFPNGGARVLNRDGELEEYGQYEEHGRYEEHGEKQSRPRQESTKQYQSPSYDEVESFEKNDDADSDFFYEDEDADDVDNEPENLVPTAPEPQGLVDDEGLSSVRSRARIEPGFGDISNLDDLDDEPEEVQIKELSKAKPTTADAPKVKQEEFSFDMDSMSNSVADDPAEADEETLISEVIIINVMARHGEYFKGSELLPVLKAQGLHLGNMSIFHRHGEQNGNGPVMFSMANMVQPGTFDIAEMDNFTTPGVSFFLQLPNKLGNMNCFNNMLDTAKVVVESLGGELKDENRSVFTAQTTEHCRQRISDLELSLLSKKS